MKDAGLELLDCNSNTRQPVVSLPEKKKVYAHRHFKMTPVQTSHHFPFQPLSLPKRDLVSCCVVEFLNFSQNKSSLVFKPLTHIPLWLSLFSDWVIPQHSPHFISLLELRLPFIKDRPGAQASLDGQTGVLGSVPESPHVQGAARGADWQHPAAMSKRGHWERWAVCGGKKSEGSCESLPLENRFRE